MARVTLRQLLEAGVHFGHQTSRWNPRMRPYIFAARNGIHIIDLQQTQALIDEAAGAMRDIVASGEKILFVGTKKQAQDTIEECCEQTGQYHVTHRWMGGMLTNFTVIQRQLKKLADLRAGRASGQWAAMSKKEASVLEDQLARLERNFGGMSAMRKLPAALFVVDCRKERLAVTEANKLGIPIIAITDSNCDPRLIRHVIPGNDDAIRAIRLIVNAVTEAMVDGQRMLTEREMQQRQSAAAAAAAENGSGAPSEQPAEELATVGGGAPEAAGA